MLGETITERRKPLCQASMWFWALLSQHSMDKRTSDASRLLTGKAQQVKHTHKPGRPKVREPLIISECLEGADDIAALEKYSSA